MFKNIVKVSKSGQKYYEVIDNYLEAKNNDGSCSLNKATFSTNLIEKLINIYGTEGDVIYDSFMGTGTTAVASLNKKCYYIGSEISKKQCEYSENRIKKP